MEHLINRQRDSEACALSDEATDPPRVKGVPIEEYPEDRYTADSLDQYELAVELADRLSARRDRMNAFFVTVISALTAVGALARNSLDEAAPAIGLAVVLFVATLICGLWALLVRSYRTLSRAKWLVIGSIEDHMPLRPFAAEYEVTERGGHRSFTVIEQWVPIVLGALFASLAAFVLFD